METEEAKEAGATETAPSAVASATVTPPGPFDRVLAKIGLKRAPSSDRRIASDSEVGEEQSNPRPTTSAVDGRTDPSPPNIPHTSSHRRQGSVLFRKKPRAVVSDPQGDSTEERTGSVSSRPTWLPRLSSFSISGSQNSSRRSSFAPESPSFSNGSGVPMLGNSGPILREPNKLAKRSTIRGGGSAADKELGRAKSFRRPATSHEREDRHLQQVKFDAGVTSTRDTSLQQTAQIQESQEDNWLDRFTSGSSHHLDSTKRIHAENISQSAQPHADPANMTTSNQVRTAIMEDQMHESGVLTPMSSSNQNSPGSAASARKERRRVSGHFGTQPFKNLITGTIGRRKRLSVEISDSDKNAPAPATASSRMPQQQTIAEQPVSEKQLIASRDDRDLSLISNTLSRPARKRDCSSPLPPLTRNSSFALDLSQIGSPSSSPSSPPLGFSMHQNNIVPMQYPAPNQSAEFGSSPPISGTQTRTYRAPDVAPSDRTSTLVGSDNEIRGFYSGEDEDTDFQSDTIFDSFRTATTGTTGSLRGQNPLESMFDRSPGTSKEKLIAQRNREIHPSSNPDFSSSEDEFAPTPIKDGLTLVEDGMPTSKDTSKDTERDASPGHDSPMSTLARIPTIEDFGRLSLEEEDDDEDWARDFDNDLGVTNSLSPPSSSLSSRHVSPKSRAPLRELKNRPSKRSLHQYSESQPEKDKFHDLPPRPKTEHGLQAHRKSPSMLLRTHSVPVPGDDIKAATAAPRKIKMTEEWDDDFFADVPDFGKAMPAAIKASQEQVRGNSGLIREFRANVEDLKRLRSASDEKKMLSGPNADLWIELAGIINLGCPDDKEGQTASPSASPTTIDFNVDAIDEQFHDCGFDAEAFDHPDEVLDGNFTESGFVAENTAVRRQSVLLPEDEIFGSADVSAEAFRTWRNQDDVGDKSPTVMPSKGATFPRVVGKDAAAFARSVLETMHQHRSISDPLHSEAQNKTLFDQGHLRHLVERSNHLIKTLSPMVAAAAGDNASQSPRRSLQRSPQRLETPAFTRVFTDPIASPPRRLPRTKSAISSLGGTPDSSPTKTHSNRFVMTVN